MRTIMLIPCFLVMIILTASCSKDQMIDLGKEEPILSESETYLNRTTVPEVIFSYNILDLETRIVSSYLINKTGKVKIYNGEHAKIDQGTIISSDLLSVMLEDSSILPDIEISLDDLVFNHSALFDADIIDYDNNLASTDVRYLTSIYGYIRYIPQHNSNCSCDGVEQPTSDNYRGNFRPILLEQSVEGELIQTNNEDAQQVISWINALYESL